MTVKTPASLVQSQPVQSSWREGTVLYFPSIIPRQQPGAAALRESPSQTGTAITQTVDPIANTCITFQVRDSTGAVQYSSSVSIQTPFDSSCVNSNVSATASGGSTATSTGGATSAAATATTTTPTGSASCSSSRASASTTSSSSAASSTSSNVVSMVTKGVFGVAGIASLISTALF